MTTKIASALKSVRASHPKFQQGPNIAKIVNLALVIKLDHNSLCLEDKEIGVLQ